jgi:hypothetical protein
MLRTYISTAFTLLLLAVIVYAVVGLVPGCHKDAKAYVECKSAGATLDTGMACTIEHQHGDVPLHVCWNMNVSCQNGAKGTAHGCGDVQPQAKSSVVLPFSAFGGALDKCDAVASANVDGMSITEAK